MEKSAGGAIEREGLLTEGIANPKSVVERVAALFIVRKSTKREIGLRGTRNCVASDLIRDP